MLHDTPPANRSTTRLENDLNYMNELSPGDRYSFVRDIMGSEELQGLKIENEPSWIKSYVIQNWENDGVGFIEATKPLVHTSSHQVFFDLDQCRILDIDSTGHRPYIRVNMSECSLLIARKGVRIWVAHIGMSEHNQMRHALQQLQTTKFTPNDLVVVASVGRPQEIANQSGYSQRLENIGDYEHYGVSIQNIIPFTFGGQTVDDQIIHQLCSVVVGTDGMLVTTYDAKSNLGNTTSKIIRESTDEHFIAL